MKLSFPDFRLAAFLLPLSLAFMAVSCTEPDDDVTPPVINPVTVYPDSLAGELNVQFVHTVDGQPLVFETQQYVNPAGDSFKVTEFRYYISNLKLKNSTTGKTLALPDSYYLVTPLENKNTVNLKGIPVKAYDQLAFSIGVDPTANATDANSGALAPENDMFWPWNTSYKFMEFEGYHIAKKHGSTTKALLLHIGGNSTYRTLNFPLSETLTFKKNQPYMVQVGVEVNELFKNPELIDFDVVKMIMDPSPNAEKMANNYANGMFSIQHIAH